MFNVIYCDPSWSYRNKKTGGNHTSGASQQYSTMTLEDICGLQVNKIIEPDCILCLWITNPLLFTHAPKVLESWGFTYRTLVTWEKLGAPGLGWWLRGNTEHCIIATRGNIKPFRICKKNIIRTKRLKHSEKPEEMRQLIDQIATKSFSVPKKLELFARKQVPNWDCFGIEIDGKTIQDKINELTCIQNQTNDIVNDTEIIDVR